MIRLAKSLSAWGTPGFKAVLKEELEKLDGRDLPLQQGLSTGSHALTNRLSVMIISVAEHEKFIRTKAGIFYAGVIAGCSCADDPTPVDEHNEYCEVQIDLDKTNAAAILTLLE
jgi:hypothetical protein